MENQIGIHIKAFDQTSKVLQDVQKRVQALGDSVASTTRGMGSNFASAGSQISSSFQRGLEAARTATLAFGVAIAGIGAGAIKSAGDLESTAAGIRSIVGSAEKANKVLLVTQDIANNSSFEFDQLATTAKMLLAYGVSAEEVGGRLKVLGNISAALGTDVNGLALAYGQVKANGKLAGEELNQFTERGVPLLDELSKMYGKSTAEMRKMIEQGRVGFPSVDQALRNLGEGSGKFATGMADQAQTMNGMFSTLKDTVKQFLGSIVGIDKVGNIIEGGLIDKIKKTLQGVLNYLNTNGPALQKKFSDIFEGIGKVVGKVINDVKPTIEGFLNGIKSFWDRNGKDIMKIAGDTWNFVIDIIKTVKEYISPLIADIVGLFDGKFSTIRDNTKSVFEGVKTAISTVLAIIVPLIRGVLKSIVDFRNKHGDDIMAAVKFAWDLVVSIIKAAATAIGPIIDGLLKVFGGIIDFLKGVFTGDWDSAWKGVGEIIDGAIEIIKGILNGFLSFFGTDISNGIKSAAEGIAGHFSWLADRITEQMNRAANAMNNAKNNIGKLVGGARSTAQNLIGGFMGGNKKTSGIPIDGGSSSQSSSSSSVNAAAAVTGPRLLPDQEKALKNLFSPNTINASIKTFGQAVEKFELKTVAAPGDAGKAGGGGVPALLGGGGGGGGGKGKSEAQKKAEEAAKKQKEAAEKLVKDMQDSLASAFDKIKDKISKAKDDLQGYRDKIKDISKSWQGFALDARKSLLDVNLELQNLYKKQDESVAQQRGLLQKDLSSRYVDLTSEIADLVKQQTDEMSANGMTEAWVKLGQEIDKRKEESAQIQKIVPKEELQKQVDYMKLSPTQKIIVDYGEAETKRNEEFEKEKQKYTEKQAILGKFSNAKLGGPLGVKTEENNGILEAFVQNATGAWEKVKDTENTQLAVGLENQAKLMQSEYTMYSDLATYKIQLLEDYYERARSLFAGNSKYLTPEVMEGWDPDKTKLLKRGLEADKNNAEKSSSGLATPIYNPQNDSAISARSAGGDGSQPSKNYNVSIVIDGKSYDNPTLKEYLEKLLEATGIKDRLIKLENASLTSSLGVK